MSFTLRRAAKLQEKIDTLREQLAGLLDQARAELVSEYEEETVLSPRRSSVPGKAPKRGSDLSSGSNVKRRSPLAGRKRAASPSGPLAPAVVKVLSRKKKPMNVSDILGQLLASGYVFNTPEPKKNLAARIYRLRGVKQISAGLFAKA